MRDARRARTPGSKMRGYQSATPRRRADQPERQQSGLYRVLTLFRREGTAEVERGPLGYRNLCHSCNDHLGGCDRLHAV